MQLRVSPAELDAASAVLTATAEQLRGAVTAFGKSAGADAPLLGRDAAGAAEQGAAATERAAGVLVEDIEQIARALRALAADYTRLDTTGMPAPAMSDPMGAGHAAARVIR